MLSRGDTSGGDTHLDQLVCGRLDSLQHPRLAPIERHQRVEVAVAGVEDVEHGEAMPLADPVYLGEHLDQLGPGTTVSCR